MVIDRSSSKPLYEQLRLTLEDKILMGELTPGMLLPTEQQLCDDYGISRITSRRALEELARDGLIERIQGKGSIVKERKRSHTKMSIMGYKKTILEQGNKPGGRLLSKEVVSGNPVLNEIFNFPKNSSKKFWLFRRLRLLNNEPVAIMNVYVTKEFGDKMLIYDLDNDSFYAIYENITNSVITENPAIITAAVASPEVALLLKTNIGSPLIWFRGIAYLEGHKPIEVNYSLFLGEKFHFETNMHRPKANNSDNPEFNIYPG